MIGGDAVFKATKIFFDSIKVPLAEPDGETFIFSCEIAGKTQKFASKLDDDHVMIEDVGLFARGPHLDSPGRMVTLLSGITSRGVHGAALCFTDRNMKDVNEKYIANHFGDASAYCILLRVRVQGGEAMTPNLSRDGVVLYEWSDGEVPRDDDLWSGGLTDQQSTIGLAPSFVIMAR